MRRVRVLLFENTLVNATGAVAGGVVDLTRLASHGGLTDKNCVLEYKASSVNGTADVKLEYAPSPDGVNFSGTLTSVVATSAGAAPAEDWKELALLITAPYLKFTLTGVGSNPADTRVTAYLVFEES